MFFITSWAVCHLEVFIRLKDNKQNSIYESFSATN